MYVRTYVCMFACMYVHYMSIVHWSRSNKRVYNLCTHIYVRVKSLPPVLYGK